MTYKRALYIIITMIFILIATPFTAITALSVLIILGTPVFFPMKRPGLHGKPFILYKLRTMTNTFYKKRNLLPDSDRLSKFGRVLRSLSLDELPELINVMKGEMSLVGPRPLLMEYLNRYIPEQMRRHEVKPGITGWAQINGRNAISWEDKFKLDVSYVDHQSFWLDVRILALTLWKTIKREGIRQPGHATMEEFLGLDKKRN